MESSDYGELWSGCVPTDILGLISSRLVGGEYFVFRSVCKKWRFAPLMPPRPPPQVHDHSPLPYLMTLRRETGIAEFFHPVYDALTHKTDIPKLKGSRIRSAKANWLLMSRGNHGMFFFNPKSNDIIELPDLQEWTRNSCCAWTFSSSPDDSSSDCFVVGFEYFGSPPPLYIIKVGESRWKYQYGDDNNQEIFQLTGCSNPIFFRNNIVYVLGDGGNLGILSIKENSATETHTWEFYGKPFSSQKQKSIRQVYMAEDIDNGGILVIFLTREEGKVEVWRYKMNGTVLKRERITSLDNKTLFVSYGASYLKSCIAQGLGNKIYFPMFHNNKGVFYSLTNRKYYSFDYLVNKAYSSPNIFNLVQPRSCIWIE